MSQGAGVPTAESAAEPSKSLYASESITAPPSTSSDDQRAPEVRPRPRFRVVQDWTTTLVAVAALVISLLTWVQANSRPNVTAAMPNQFRIAQGQQGTWIYVQPTFLVDRKSDRTVTIDTMSLRLHRVDGRVPDPSLYWDESGQFTYDSATGGLNYQYLADPSPLIVTHDKSQAPLALFAADRYALSAGQWNGELIAQYADSPIVARFCIIIKPADLAFFESQGNDQFRAFRNDVKNGDTSAQTNCYNGAG